MRNLMWVLFAAIAFVGTHFAMSHPLRKKMVSRLGEAAFLVIYSLVSIATLLWLALAYRAVPPGQHLWSVGNVLWAMATVVMLLASILLMGSFARNPALPAAGRPPIIPDQARGVLAITRHPMMWAFALWALCHIAVYPVPANMILAGSILLLALVGAAMQDRKKLALQPVLWKEWQARTSYLPFAAIAAGRAHMGSLRWQVLVAALLLWFALSWAHLPLYGIGAGIWRWIH